MTVVLDKRRIHYEAPGDPSSFFQAIAFPVDKIQGAMSTASRIKNPLNGVDRTTINDPRQRRSRFLGRWRRKENRLILVHVKNKVNPERDRQLEVEGERSD